MGLHQPHHIKAVRHNRMEANTDLDRLFDEVQGDLRLGVESRSAFAVRQAGHRHVRRHMQGMITLLIGPKRGDRDDTVIDLAD